MKTGLTKYGIYGNFIGQYSSDLCPQHSLTMESKEYWLEYMKGITEVVLPEIINSHAFIV